MKKLNLVLAITVLVILLQRISFAQPNLVSNPDFSSGNTGFSSQYVYCNTQDCMGICGGCPNMYTVGTNATYYHALLIGTDHTTGTGNFMIVDGGLVPDIYVWRQIIPVSINSIYSFSYWLSTLYPVAPANLKVVINGIDVGTPINAPPAINTWIQKSISWNSGTSTTATIDIINLDLTFVGNGFGLDDFSFTKVCNSITPEICSIVPLQNDLNITKSADLSVEFMQSMNASSINSSNIKVFGEQTGLVSTNVSYDAGTKTATIDPNSDLKIGEKIQVVLTSAIQTSSNVSITPYTWTFTVQAVGGTGIFTEAENIGPVLEIDISTLTGDFDNDQDIDICVLEFQLGFKVHLLKNNGSGNFSQTVTSNLTHVSTQTIATLTGDFDNDGDLDIALSFINGDINIYKNNSAGTFVYSSTIQGYGSNHLKHSDLDNDGDLDLVSFRDEGSIGVGIYFILKNDGFGNFSLFYNNYTGCSCPIESDHLSHGLLVNDFDKDGDIDIIIEGSITPGINPNLNCYCSYITVLFNNGNATFSFGADINTQNVVGEIISDDIDGNGFNDFLMSTTDIYTNNNLNISHSNFPGNGGQILTGDYDGDGDLDIAEQLSSQYTLNVLNNNGAGSFTAHSTSSALLNNYKIKSADLDSDGDLDLLGINNTSRKVSVIFNDYDCPPLNPILSGNFAIPVNSSGYQYTSSASLGYWDIANYDSCQASIPPNSTGNSVRVTSGSKVGHFVLYFIARNNCGDTVLVSKHGYVENPASPLNLSMAAVPEGFLNTSSNTSNLRDTLSIYLRNISAPYSIVDSARSVLDSVSLTLQLNFTNAQSGYYYIVVRHRNSLETWSKLGGKLFIKGITSYHDFTSSKFQAYGNNLILKGSLYCLIGGDVNQDGIVDAADASLTDNDVLNFGSGYIKTDVTGDMLADASDIAIVDNNVLNFESAKSPLTGDNFLRGESGISNLRENSYGNSSSAMDENIYDLPKNFYLENNYPNPFNPTTKIKFSLPSETNVKLAVYDITGREVSVLENQVLKAGVFEYQWNGAGSSSGVYFYKLTAGSFSQVKKMILSK